MTKKLAVKEMVTIREMLMANAIQVDAIAQLLIEKGIITEQDFFTKLKKVQADYQRRGRQEALKKEVIKV
jgi:hypothetical protein